MGSKKLVLCCIAGIVLGFLAPFVLPVARSTSLSIGMVAGLGIGYLLDVMDEKKTKDADVAVISKKADEAVRLLEHARAEIGEHPEPADDENTMTADHGTTEPELSETDQEEKLNEAEELLKKARERIK